MLNKLSMGHFDRLRENGRSVPYTHKLRLATCIIDELSTSRNSCNCCNRAAPASTCITDELSATYNVFL